MNDLVNVKVGGVQDVIRALQNYNTIILKPNIVDNRNVLTQEMMSERHTKYIIRWNYSLEGATINVPEDCIVEFAGGTVDNGTIVGNNTMLMYSKPIDEVCPAERQGTFIYNTTVADEEDITSASGQLKFKDRPDTDGMGRKILRKNIVDGVNTLTQNMINAANTIYIIQYDFTLGEDITVPANCVLEFNGGSISGEHTITSNNTGINAGLEKIFGLDITLSGLWQVSEAYPEWFGAKGTAYSGNADFVDDTEPLQKCIDYFRCIHLTRKYAVSHITLPGRRMIYGNGPETIIRPVSIQTESTELYLLETQDGTSGDLIIKDLNLLGYTPIGEHGYLNGIHFKNGIGFVRVYDIFIQSFSHIGMCCDSNVTHIIDGCTIRNIGKQINGEWTKGIGILCWCWDSIFSNINIGWCTNYGMFLNSSNSIVSSKIWGCGMGSIEASEDFCGLKVVSNCDVKGLIIEENPTGIIIYGAHNNISVVLSGNGTDKDINPENSAIYFNKTSLTDSLTNNNIDVTLRNPALAGYNKYAIGYAEEDLNEINNNVIKITGKIDSSHPWFVSKPQFLWRNSNTITVNGKPALDVHHITNTSPIDIPLGTAESSGKDIKITVDSDTLSTSVSKRICTMYLGISVSGFYNAFFKTFIKNKEIFNSLDLYIGIRFGDISSASSNYEISGKDGKYFVATINQSTASTPYLGFAMIEAKKKDGVTGNIDIYLSDIEFSYDTDGLNKPEKFYLSNGLVTSGALYGQLANAQLIANKKFQSDTENVVFFGSDGKCFRGKYKGTTRPTTLTSTMKGFQFYDETLNKPIYWTGTAWVDATGATV